MARRKTALASSVATVAILAVGAGPASASSSEFVPLGPGAGTLHIVATPSGQLHERILHPPSPCSEASGNPNCAVNPGGGS
jgi:hypothetical protein